MNQTLPDYLPRVFDRVHIELTNLCNFSCSFCPDGVMKRKRGLMDAELAKSALDQISDLRCARKVTFHVMGEPLMHPRFLEIVDHAHARNLKIGLTTNGALLKPDIMREIASRDLHQIDISLQTPDEESFYATRGKGMDFSEYRSRILTLLKACAARPNPPIFKFRVMVTRFAGGMRRKLSIPDFLKTNAELRQTVMDWTRLIYEQIGKPLPPSGDMRREIDKISVRGWNVIEVSPRIFIETYLLTNWGNTFTDGPIVKADFGYCFGMRDHFAILYNGDVTLCCVDYEGRAAVGNLKKSSLGEILAGPGLKRIVQSFKKGRIVHPYCKECLGSSSRVGALLKPVMTIVGLKALKPFFYRKYRLYK